MTNSNPEQEPTYANLPPAAAGQAPQLNEDLTEASNENQANDDPAKVGLADNTDE